HREYVVTRNVVEPGIQCGTGGEQYEPGAGAGGREQPLRPLQVAAECPRTSSPSLHPVAHPDATHHADGRSGDGEPGKDERGRQKDDPEVPHNPASVPCEPASIRSKYTRRT